MTAKQNNKPLLTLRNKYVFEADIKHCDFCAANLRKRGYIVTCQGLILYTSCRRDSCTEVLIHKLINPKPRMEHGLQSETGVRRNEMC